MIGLLDVVRESALEHPLLVEYPPEQHPLVQTRFHQQYVANCAKYRCALRSLQGHHNGSLLSPLCQVDMLESFVQHFSNEILLASSNIPLLGEAQHGPPKNFDIIHGNGALQSNARSHRGMRGLSAPSGFNQFNIFGNGMEIDIGSNQHYMPQSYRRENTNSTEQSVRPSSNSTVRRSGGVRFSQSLEEYDGRGASTCYYRRDTGHYSDSHQGSTGIPTSSPSYTRSSVDAFIYTNQEGDEHEGEVQIEEDEIEIGEGVLHELPVDFKCEDQGEYPPQSAAVQEYEDDEDEK